MQIGSLDIIDAKISSFLAHLSSNVPARVIEYDATTQSMSVQPLLNNKYDDGVIMEPPVILDVPVLFVSGGGGLLSFPIQIGDLVLLCVSQQDIDSWKHGQGGLVTPRSNRRMDLTDAIAIAGLHTLSNNLAPSATDVELKFKGSSIRIAPSGDITVEVTTGQNVNVIAPTVNVTATDVNVSATNVNVNSTTITATTSSATINTDSLTANCTASASVVAPTIGLTGATTITGNLNVTGTLTGPAAIDIFNHIHTGDSGGDTGLPK